MGSVVVVGFFFQAEGGIRDRVRSRGLGDVYKRQDGYALGARLCAQSRAQGEDLARDARQRDHVLPGDCLLYTSDAADERSSVDLGGRRIIKKKTQL